LLLQLNLKTGDGRRIEGARLAYREAEEGETIYTKKTAERNLILTSMIGLENPPRPEVADAIQKCRRANGSS
jgi:magnesium-transporting ATPase (P-type)